MVLRVDLCLKVFMECCRENAALAMSVLASASVCILFGEEVLVREGNEFPLLGSEVLVELEALAVLEVVEEEEVVEEVLL